MILFAAGRALLPKSLSLLFVLLFFGVDVISADSISKTNAIREAIQMAELSLFTFTLALYRAHFDWMAMARAFIFVAVAITAFNIWWHLDHGFLVGWKRLNEPKMLFSYAPPVILSLLLLRKPRALLSDYLIIVLLGTILILSGERKALGAFLLCILIITAVGFTRPSVLALGGWITGFALSSVIITTPYLRHQFDSFLTLRSTAELTIGDLKVPDPELSESNMQRTFAARVSADLVGENLVFGVGTNGYAPYVKSTYSDYPRFITIEIHNEFQRVLVENGLVGLFFYLLPWIRSFLFGFRLYAASSDRRFVAIYSMFYVVIAVQCFFEGGGNEAFVAFIILALLPEFFALGGALG